MGNSFIQTFLLNKRSLFYILSGILVCLSIVTALFLGTVSLTVLDILQIIVEKTTGMDVYHGVKNMEMIIWQIRFPRVLVAFFVGAALGLAGAAFQGLLRNPLADPYTIGVSSGASLGAVMVLYFQWNITWFGSYTLPVIGIMTGFVTLLLVFGITKLASGTLANETIILSGIILSSFISALNSLIIALSPREDVSQILYWLMGSVSMRGWGHMQLLLPFFLVGAFIILIHYRELNGFALGDQSAQFMGINVKRKKTWILIGASLLTGSAVAVSGAIGFVGLVIPHLVRLVVGANHKHVLPLSILIGGSYLVFADLIARMVIEPRELPIGVVTALIGSPVFTFLLIKQRSRRRGLS
ncbi:iron ABC transporter permease [Bacillus sp. CGMCC 1.16541]|uniref:FecCD family ABC transporter permease n=1 Tax=Bacillus sp. CGMCC 1.16541 TaxID=2185143 RepID=UPI000D73CF41|nr:iron ABC transporter permease [Bacillus sp. CGMCC 1.16541]